MQILNVTLENIKSYRKATIHLSQGTTAIRGHNGAGKSTLVEAVGYALFDFLPYSPAARFVREGEKLGKVVVAFVSALDERLYEVERRCATSGSGAWFVYDPELRVRVAEGKEDMHDFLRLHLGVQTTLPLADLFDNAIAVQQGTFTADFLQTAKNRSKKFDALLQVEEYRDAVEGLRETVSYVKDQLAARDRVIAELTAQTADVPAYRDERARLATETISLTDQMAQLFEERATIEQTLSAIATLMAELARRQEARTQAEHALHMATQQWQTAQATLDRAREAQAICATAAPDAARYRAAQTALEQAQRDADRMNILEKEQARTEQTLREKATAIQGTQQRLAQAQTAAQERDRLAPLAQRQSELETALQGAKEAQQRATIVRQSLQQVAADRDVAQQEAQQTATQITHLVALEPLAAQKDERRQDLDRLKQEQAARRERQQRHQSLMAQEQRQQQRVAKADEAVRVAGKRVAEVTALLPEVATLAKQQQALTALVGQMAQIQAEITQAEDALHASQGGMCPFLKEPCQNMARRGIANLDDYFSGQITRHLDALHPLEAAHAATHATVTRLVALQAQAERLPEYQQQLTQAQTEWQEHQTESERLRAEIDALATAIDDQTQQQAALVIAEARMQESAEADRNCAKLPTLRSALSRLQAQLATLTERQRQHETELVTVETQAAQATSLVKDLQTLGDPRKAFAQAEALAQHVPTIQAELAQLVADHDAAQQALTTVQHQLAPFAGLVARIAALQATLQQTAAAHEALLRHEAEAQRLPAAEAEAQHLHERRLQAEAATHTAQQAFDALAATHDPQALAAAQTRQRELDAQLATYRERLSQTRARSTQLDAAIAEAEQRLAELAIVLADREALTATQSLLAYGRDTIKEAGPFVMRALLREISDAANRIFGEIMGDRSATLTWQEDYDIVLRSNAYERHFAQLSGGEQMSAALAVRLALLRTLTRATIAFFDEPTQNMDDERRTNLAGQIRRISGFDQLLVISHDDTFEEGLDAVVWVRKEAGESQVESDPHATLPAPLLTFPAAIGA